MNEPCPPPRLPERPSPQGTFPVTVTGAVPSAAYPGAANAAQASPASSGPDGFVLLDKARGPSSFQALYPLKRLFRGRKVGHAGTLDPDASGLLLVGIGNATRLLEYLEGMPKTYTFSARFGITSDSYDMRGEIAAASGPAALAVATLTEGKVSAALVAFRGRIWQTPPDYSAIKVDGLRACDRVRAGETVSLASREVDVHSLTLLAFETGNAGANPSARFTLTCSKGTYVRSLVHDLGQALGCGAAADDIRRTALGPFRVEEAWTPDNDMPPAPLPLEAAVSHLPAATLLPERVSALLGGLSTSPTGYVLTGATLPSPGEPARECRVFDPQGRFLAIATLTPEGMLCPKKVLARNP